MEALSEKIGESQKKLREFAKEHYIDSGYSEQLSAEMSNSCVSQRDIQVNT